MITAAEARLALRLIAKQPVLSITIVLALATGVCLATIGFTLRDAVLNGSLPFDAGGRFVRLVLHSDADDNVEVDLDRYHAIRDTSKSFAHVGAVGSAEYALESGDGTVEPIRVGLITPRSFASLPAAPMLGRRSVARGTARASRCRLGWCCDPSASSRSVGHADDDRNSGPKGARRSALRACDGRQ